MSIHKHLANETVLEFDTEMTRARPLAEIYQIVPSNGINLYQIQRKILARNFFVNNI